MLEMEDEKFEKVYRRYRPVVMKAAFEILGDFYLAQDVCQDVFMKLNINRVEKGSPMERYLYVLSRNCAIDYSRERECRRETSFEEDDEVMLEIVEMSLEDKIACEQAVSALFAGLREHNEEWYEIYVRLKLYEEPQEYVARKMNISIGLLRTKHYRAKLWLRKNFKEEYQLLEEL